MRPLLLLAARIRAAGDRAPQLEVERVTAARAASIVKLTAKVIMGKDRQTVTPVEIMAAKAKSKLASEVSCSADTGGFIIYLFRNFENLYIVSGGCRESL
jgi:hypothetical protein